MSDTQQEKIFAQKKILHKNFFYRQKKKTEWMDIQVVLHVGEVTQAKMLCHFIF